MLFSIGVGRLVCELSLGRKSVTLFLFEFGPYLMMSHSERLAELMVEYDVGVGPVATYEIKKIDSDYFIEE